MEFGIEQGNRVPRILRTRYETKFYGHGMIAWLALHSFLALHLHTNMATGNMEYGIENIGVGMEALGVLNEHWMVHNGDEMGGGT